MWLHHSTSLLRLLAAFLMTTLQSVQDFALDLRGHKHWLNWILGVFNGLINLQYKWKALRFQHVWTVDYGTSVNAHVL